MKIILLLFLSCFFTIVYLVNINGQSTNNQYSIIKDEDGIYVEHFDSTYRADDRFTENNQLYKENRVFIYTYKYLNKQGQAFLYQKIPHLSSDNAEKAWKFVPFTVQNDSAVNKIKITVQKGLQGFDQHFPDYNQTIIKYEYLTSKEKENYSEQTGLIENEQNIWMHPPRTLLFRILELNPFPFIQAPYQVGNQWNWSLEIGQFWGDERWKTWEGRITNDYTYNITDVKKIQTPLGEVTCFVIKCEAKSRIGLTYLTALFSFVYGFIQLDYTNIDGSKLIMDLVEVSGY